jgi:hypothetical protein
MQYDSFLYQHCDEQRYEKYPRDGKGIRKVHQFPPTVEIPVNKRLVTGGSVGILQFPARRANAFLLNHLAGLLHCCSNCGNT